MLTEFLKRLALRGQAEWLVHNCAFGEAFTVPCPKNGFLVMEQIIFNGFDNNTDEVSVQDILKRTVICLSMVEQGKQDEIFYNLRMPVISTAANNVGYIPSHALIIPTFKIFKANINIDLAIWPDFDTFVAGTGAFDSKSQERPSVTGYGTNNVVGQVSEAGAQNYFPNPTRPQLGIAVGGPNVQQARPVFGPASVMSLPQDTIGQRNSQNKPPFFSIGYWKCNGSPEQLDDVFIK